MEISRAANSYQQIANQSNVINADKSMIESRNQSLSQIKDKVDITLPKNLSDQSVKVLNCQDGSKALMSFAEKDKTVSCYVQDVNGKMTAIKTENLPQSLKSIDTAEKFNGYMNNTYAKTSVLSDGDIKVDVSQQLKGGMQRSNYDPFKSNYNPFNGPDFLNKHFPELSPPEPVDRLPRLPEWKQGIGCDVVKTGPFDRGYGFGTERHFSHETQGASRIENVQQKQYVYVKPEINYTHKVNDNLSVKAGVGANVRYTYDNKLNQQLYHEEKFIQAQTLNQPKGVSACPQFTAGAKWTFKK